MNLKDKINLYIDSQSEPKRNEMVELHNFIQQIMPGCKLWFMDGKNDAGKTISNPNIGYGSYTIKYVDGSMREFYQIGLSANTTGISVYIMGIEDKTFLPEIYGKTIGKAIVTGYCIKFKTLKDIHSDTLKMAIQSGVKH
jgi:hypothetical protein